MEEGVKGDYDYVQCENETEEMLRRPWMLKFMNEVQEITKKFVLCWCHSVIDLGESEIDVQEWCDIFKNHIKGTYSELVDDVINMKTKVVDEVQTLLSRLAAICHELQVPIPLYNDKLNMYQQLREVGKLVEKYENIREERKKKVRELLERQLKLCKLLDKTILIKDDESLPSQNDISNLNEYVEELEAERFSREERFIQLRSEIVDMVAQLNYKPSLEFEKEIVFSTSEFAVSKTNMRQIETLHINLSEELRKVKEEIKYLRKKVEDLWYMLDIDIAERDVFREKCRGHSLDVLNDLKLEVQRCNVLVKENIKVFIEKRRKELDYLWDKCHCSGKDKSNFQFFYSDVYSEDLLEIHEREVEKWQNFYEKNKELFSLLEKHKSLWQQLRDLENASEGINRYKNRGGKLLLEEKSRNTLSKKIPACEERIRALCEEYELTNGRPFTTFGKTIEEYFENLHEEREQQRKARKKETPGKLLMSINPSTSGMKKTPMSKRKLEIPKSSNKKSRILKDLNSTRAPNVLPVIKVECRTSRRSIEKQLQKRKLHYSKLISSTSGCKPFAATPSKENNPNYEEYESEEDLQYPVFEKLLDSKDGCRSTAFSTMGLLTPKRLIYEKNDCRSAPTSSILKTPKKTKTPTPSKSPRTPGGQHQLKAAPNKLKLIF